MRASLVISAVASLAVAMPLGTEQTQTAQDQNVTTNNILQDVAIYRCRVGPAFGTPKVRITSKVEDLPKNPATGRPMWPDDIYDPKKAGNYTECLAEAREAIRYCKYYGEGGYIPCSRIELHYRKMTKRMVNWQADLAAIRRWRRHIWLTASRETPNEGYPEWHRDGKWPDHYWETWDDDEPIIPAEPDEVRPWDRPGNPRPKKKKQGKKRRESVEDLSELSSCERLRDRGDKPRYGDSNPDPALQVYDPIKATPVDIAGCLVETEEVMSYLRSTGPTHWSLHHPEQKHLQKVKGFYADLITGQGDPKEIMDKVRRLRMNAWLRHGAEADRGYPEHDYQGFWPEGWWDEKTRPIDPPKKGEVRPWLKDLEVKPDDDEEKI